MFEEAKFLRELPVLHGKIELPDYKGVCTGIYLICENDMGFISIFCTNERKENAMLADLVTCVFDLMHPVPVVAVCQSVQDILRCFGVLMP